MTKQYVVKYDNTLNIISYCHTQIEIHLTKYSLEIMRILIRFISSLHNDIFKSQILILLMQDSLCILSQ